MTEVTATASLIIPLGEYMRDRGRDVSGPLSAAGLSLDVLDDPKLRLPVGQVARTFEEASSALADPCLAIHYANAFPVGGFGVHGHLALSAPTVGGMLRLAVGYVELTLSPISQRVDEENGATVFGIMIPGSGSASFMQLGTFLLAVTIVRLRKALGDSWHPSRVSFAGQPPAAQHRPEYRRMFGTNLQFDARTFEFAVTNDILERPNPFSMVGLQATIQEVADRQLDARRKATGTTGEVIRAVLERLHGDKGIQLLNVAQDLGMSPRALQLRLKDEETTFEAVVTGVRKGLAEELLRDTNMPVSVIAYRLGFADPSGLSRWYKANLGMSPTAHRDQLRSADG